jgi:hypothetical protein
VTPETPQAAEAAPRDRGVLACHLTQLLGAVVVAAGAEVGRVVDLGVRPGLDEWPVVAARVRRRGREPVVRGPSMVAGRLAVASSAGAAPRDEEGVVWLRADVLDHRVIDVDGRRVVRVGDLQLEQSGRGLSVVAVELGWEPLLRRVGLGPVARRLRPTLLPLSALHVPGSSPGQIDLTTTAARLAALESHDLAALLTRLSLAEASDVMADLPAADAARAVDALHAEHAADILAEAPPAVSERIVRQLPAEHRVPHLRRHGRPPRRVTNRRLSAHGHRRL